MVQKACNKCGTLKDLSEFHNVTRNKDGKHGSCKECQREYYRKQEQKRKETASDRWSSFKEKNPTYRRSYDLRVWYGLTIEEYDNLLEFQGGGCAICGKPCASGKRLAVDHDHTTGEVRALLCMRCNKFVIGNLNLKTAEAAFEYLKYPPARRFFGGERYVPIGKEKGKPRRRRRKRTK